MSKGQLASILADFKNTLTKRFRIPPGQESFSCLTILNLPGPWRQNSTPIDTVSENRLEGSFTRRQIVSGNNFLDRLRSQVELTNPLAQPLRPTLIMNNGLPDSGHRIIQLNQLDMIDKALGNSRQSNDCATGERLDKLSQTFWLAAQPLAKARDKPGLSAGVAKRAALRNRGNIDHKCWIIR